MENNRETVEIVHRFNNYLLRVWVSRQTSPPWLRLLTSLLFVLALFLLIIIVGITAIFLHDIVPVGFSGRFFIAAVVWAVSAYWVGRALRLGLHKRHTKKSRK